MKQKINRISVYFFILLFVSFFSSCFISSVPSDTRLAQMTRSQKWQLIKNGMTQKQVIKILGNPNSRKKWSDQMTFTYECFTCTVTFSQNGRVWSYHTPELR